MRRRAPTRRLMGMQRRSAAVVLNTVLSPMITFWLGWAVLPWWVSALLLWGAAILLVVAVVGTATEGDKAESGS